MSRPRLLLADLDGTLLDNRGYVTPRTRAAVRAVQRAGHVFVIATGRPVRDVRRIVEALDHRAVAICGNGSISYDYAREEVVDYRPIAPQDVAAVLVALRAALPGARLGAERGLDLVLENGFALSPAQTAEATWVPTLERALDGRGAGKVIVQSIGSALDYRAAVTAAVPGRCAVTVSTTAFCELTRHDVTKASALDRLGLDRETSIAFGDMPNDESMLRWAGWSVAMANAHPSILAIVDEVTSTNHEDGVARCLERLLDGDWPGSRRCAPNGASNG